MTSITEKIKKGLAAGLLVAVFAGSLVKAAEVEPKESGWTFIKSKANQGWKGAKKVAQGAKEEARKRQKEIAVAAAVGALIAAGVGTYEHKSLMRSEPDLHKKRSLAEKVGASFREAGKDIKKGANKTAEYVKESRPVQYTRESRPVKWLKEKFSKKEDKPGEADVSGK